MTQTIMIEYAGATLFALAVLHTFSAKWFEHLSHGGTRHAELWHLPGEVEVVLGGQHPRWLQPILSGMDATVLFFGATGLTAITDNAALTYLGSLVEDISHNAKYALVTGAIAGGGLTVIANAPNPAGFAILNASFNEQSINPLGLFLSALLPIAVAALCFLLL